MKVLVTGSSGFVGREVCAELRRNGHSVIEFDLDKGKSILNEEQLLTEMKKATAVIHLAGIVESTNPSLWEINVKGTQNVAHSAVLAKVKKLIFMSTTGIYGFTSGAVDEKTQIDPENVYEKSKASGEKIILGVRDKTHVNIIRSAMIFGANSYWKKMLSMLKKKSPLPCSGTNTFQVIYVKELARATVQVLSKGKSGETYLVSGEEKKTLNEFCEMAQKELGVEVGVKHIPTFVGVILGKVLGIKLLTLENIRHISKKRDYDTSKIRKIGYKQKTTLANAIKEVVKELNKKK